MKDIFNFQLFKIVAFTKQLQYNIRVEKGKKGTSPNPGTFSNPRCAKIPKGDKYEFFRIKRKISRIFI